MPSFLNSAFPRSQSAVKKARGTAICQKYLFHGCKYKYRIWGAGGGGGDERLRMVLDGLHDVEVHAEVAREEGEGEEEDCYESVIGIGCVSVMCYVLCVVCCVLCVMGRSGLD